MQMMSWEYSNWEMVDQKENLFFNIYFKHLEQNLIYQVTNLITSPTSTACGLQYKNIRPMRTQSSKSGSSCSPPDSQIALSSRPMSSSRSVLFVHIRLVGIFPYIQNLASLALPSNFHLKMRSQRIQIPMTINIKAHELVSGLLKKYLKIKVLRCSHL